MAEEDKMRYQGEVQAWARAHPDLAHGLHKPKLPTKRGMNGYVLFMKDFQCASPAPPLCGLDGARWRLQSTTSLLLQPHSACNTTQ